MSESSSKIASPSLDNFEVWVEVNEWHLNCGGDDDLRTTSDEPGLGEAPLASRLFPPFRGCMSSNKPEKVSIYLAKT